MLTTLRLQQMLQHLLAGWVTSEGRLGSAQSLAPGAFSKIICLKIVRMLRMSCCIISRICSSSNSSVMHL
jgi:hypothetical protein